MQSPSKRTRNTIVFFASAVVWLGFDQLTKALADAAVPGAILWPGISGVFDLRLVHNIGAAWGIFAGNTFGLAVFGAVVCAAILLAAHLRRSTGTVAEMLALALIFAGGAGNAIDRFLRGYVVDFFDFNLINYPVFNVADVGVVCGFVLLMIVILRAAWHTDNRTGSDTQEDRCGK